MKVSKIVDNDVKIVDGDIEKLKLLYKDEFKKFQTMIDFDISRWLLK